MKAICNKFAAPDNEYQKILVWPRAPALMLLTWRGANLTPSTFSEDLKHLDKTTDNVMGRAIPPIIKSTRHGLINISSFKPPAPWPKTSICFFFQTKKSIQKMFMVLPNVLPKKMVGFFCKPQMGRESGCFSQISDL